MKRKTIRFTIILIISLLLISIAQYFLLSFPETLAIKRANHSSSNHTLFQFILSAIIFAPIIEECLFRSIHLINSRSVKLCLSAIVAVIVLFLCKPLGYTPARLYSLISFVLCYLALSRINITHIVPKNSRKRTIFLLVTSSILFGFFHVNPENVAFSLPVLYLGSRHSITGFMLGYIRIKNGLAWSVLMHFCINGSALLFLYLSR